MGLGGWRRVADELVGADGVQNAIQYGLVQFNQVD